MSIGVNEKRVMLFVSEQVSASSGSPQFAIVSPSVHTRAGASPRSCSTPPIALPEPTPGSRTV